MSKLLTRGEVACIAGVHGGIGVLHACGGFYGCQDGPDGAWQGPLVGYAKRIKDAATGREVQMVGKKYYNFAMVEGQPRASDWFAEKLAYAVSINAPSSIPTGLPNLVVAAPMGGIVLGSLVASRLFEARYAFAEKEVLEVATEGRREKSRLKLARHEIPMYSQVLLVEDVCNNFSTTQELCELLEQEECQVVGIACALNRSGHRDWSGGIPVFAVIDAPTEQWREDEDIIQAYLAQGGEIIRKPKAEWDKLMAAMEQFGIAA